MYRAKEKHGFWHMFPLPNPKMANEPWHMLVSVIAPGHHLPGPSRRTPESLKPQKMGRSVAIFPKKNYDNLIDVGWISVQARAATGCLDMFGYVWIVRFCITLQKSRNSCWSCIYFIQSEFAASCGCQVAKVGLAHASSGLCLVDSVVAVPCFPHFSTACICQAPSNEPAHFTNLLQAIHGIPRGNKA